jgi:CRP-like cAMP-binding protein
MADELIQKLARRDVLSAEERTWLASLVGPTKNYPAGTALVREHERLHESTLLVSGIAARYAVLRDGMRQITALHVAGDFIDLHSLLLKVMDHAIDALTDCTVVQVPHQKLVETTERFPHLSRVLWLDTVIDGATHRRWMTAMGRQDGAARLAHLLCELYLRLQQVGLASDEEFDLPLTQAVLGDVLGLSTVHVNRLIALLRRSGLISWSGRRVAILDWEGLADLAEFDPTYLRLQQEPV